jgi:hypothetical protein
MIGNSVKILATSGGNLVSMKIKFFNKIKLHLVNLFGVDLKIILVAMEQEERCHLQKKLNYGLIQ